jgi:hypothetical protein
MGRDLTVPSLDTADVWWTSTLFELGYLCFICDGFSFYTQDHEVISLQVLHKYHLKSCVTSMCIHFCFDKSPRNFRIRKFRCRKDPILEPVAAAVSCIHHVDLLGVTAWEPIGVSGSVYSCSFLCNYHITSIMQKGCIWAYPNPSHEMELYR